MVSLRQWRPYLFQRLIILVLGAAVVDFVSAAEWTTSAGVEPGVMYTDNVCLSIDDEQGQWVGLLTPDVAINGEGHRANMYLDASIEMNTLSDKDLIELGCDRGSEFTNRKQFAPRMNAAADAVLLENWLFIDARAGIDQGSVTPFLAGGGDSLDRTGNTNTLYYYNISPYISRRFKDVSVLNLRYIWDEQENSTDLLRDSSQQRVAFSLSSAPQFGAVSWGLQADYSRVKYSATQGIPANDSELKSAQVNLGYQISRSWQINGHYGEEKNDFVSLSDVIDGRFWDVGLRWTPNSRTTVDAGIGDRFFGSAPRFEINHRHKRSVFTASYRKDLSYDRNIRTLNAPGQPEDPTTISESPILDERFTLSYAYEGRQSTVKISASHSDQTRAEDGRDSIFRRASVNLNRTLSRKVKVSGGLSWDETDPRGPRSDFIAQSETWRATLGAQRHIYENLNLSLDFVYRDRQSDNSFDEYQENRITLSIQYTL